MKTQRITLLAALAVLSVFASTVQAGSLWLKESNNEQSMFADKRARSIGDIVTVVVSESTTAVQEQSIKTYDNSKNGIGAYLTNLTNEFIKATTPVITNALAKATGVAVNSGNSTGGTVDLAANSEFNGGGTITNRQTVSNRTAVTVVDVLPNGNLVIEGAKIIRAGKETQYAYLRGIIRQLDIQKDNTVLSTNIADAQVEFIPEGELTEAQKKGWLLNAWDHVKPF